MNEQNAPTGRRAAFLTLGCKVNQIETAAMTGLFRRAGYTVVDFSAAADVYVVNTCSVTSLGEKKSRQLIRRAHRLNPAAVIVVAGCYAQLDPERLAAIDGVKLVIGNRDRQRIVELAERAAQSPAPVKHVSDIRQAREFEEIPLLGDTDKTRAFLKIQEGCENFCTYCIIPYTRGPLRSRQLAAIRRETERLTANGHREIVLTGIHIGAYGRDFADGTTLADAVAAVLATPGVARLRLGSLECIEADEKLLALFRRDERLAPHLHLPLQAGSDAVLRKMNRHYTVEEFTSLVAAIRRAVPGIALTTDIIVGFPGETEELFAETLATVEKIGFSRIHVFPYSRRPGTPAAAMPDQIPGDVKKDRVHRLEALGEKLARRYFTAQLGRVESVILETAKDGVSDGLTGTYIRVYTDAPLSLGEFHRLRLARLYRDGVWGEPAEKNPGAAAGIF